MSSVKLMDEAKRRAYTRAIQPAKLTDDHQMRLTSFSAPAVVRHAKNRLALVATVVISVASAVAAPQDNSETTEEIRVFRVGRVTTDITQLFSMREHHDRLHTDGIDDPTPLNELLEMVESLNPADADSRQNIARYQFYLTEGLNSKETSFGLDIVYPGNRDVLLKLLKSEEVDYVEKDGNIFLLDDDVPVVQEGNYFAIPQTPEASNNPKQIQRLRQRIQEMQDLRNTETVRFDAHPTQIGRSPIKPTLDGLRAKLLTQSQRRDKETTLPYLLRSLNTRFLVTVLDGFVNDVEQLSFSLSYLPETLETRVELRAALRKRSDTDQWAQSIGTVRNRTISWVHPRHLSFLSVSLPIPELLDELLPRITAESLKTLQETIAINGGPLTECLSRIRERSTLDCLVQVMPADNEDLAYFAVFPFPGADSLESSTIALAAAVDDDNIRRNVAEAGGWPVHSLTIDDSPLRRVFVSPETPARLFWVMTEDSIVIMLGTEDSIDDLEAICLRDFEPPEALSRYRRTAMSARVSQMILQHFGLANLPKKVAEATPDSFHALVDTIQNDELKDTVTVSVRTEPQTVVLSATFAENALMAALTSYLWGIEVLAELVSEFEELR